MEENTIYLLYDNTATDIELQHEPTKQADTEKLSLLWDYMEKGKFTILYSADDKRQFTDIKIVSKTKLKDRPKTANVLFTQPKGRIHGVAIRRSSSFSNIEDLFLMRRSPIIKPLLSEAEIIKLQRLQEECKEKQFQYDVKKTSIAEKDTKEDKLSLFSDNQELSKYIRFDDEHKMLVTLESPNEKIADLVPPIDLKHKRRRSGDQWDTEWSAGGKTANKQVDFSHKVKRSKGKSLGKAVSVGLKKTLANEKSDVRKKLSRRQESIEKLKHNKTVEKRVKSIPKSTDRKSKIISEYIESEMKKKINGFQSKEGIVTSVKTKSKPSLSRIPDYFSKSPTETEEKRSGEKSSKHKGKSKGKMETLTISSYEDSKGISPLVREKSAKPSKSGKGKSVKTDEMSYVQDENAKSTIKSSTKEKRKRSKIQDTTDKVQLTKVKSSQDKLQLSEVSTTEKGSSKTGRRKTKSTLSHPSTAAKGSRTSVLTPFSRLKDEIKEDASQKKSKAYSGVLQYMIRYVLSNPLFIRLGWTLHPIDKALSRVVTFKTLPANPQTYCFRKRNEMEEKFYSSGNLAIKIEQDGTGYVYYPSGYSAVAVTKNDAGMRLTIYSDVKNDPLVKDSFHARVLSMFDSYGNGVVYDTKGKKVLNFNQLGGIFKHVIKKMVYKWHWERFKVLEKQVAIELLNSLVNEDKQQLPAKYVSSPSKIRKSVTEKKSEGDKTYEDILAELPYPVAHKSKVKSDRYGAGFKSIVLKINEEMSLRISGQDNVIVNFCSNKVFYRFNLGVIIDPETVVRIDELAPDKITEVPCVFEALLGLTPSLQHINQQLNRTNGHRKKSVLWGKR